MDEHVAPPFPAIDQIANGGELLMLKAAIPYVNFSDQKFLAMFVKILELENIVQFYERQDSPMKACSHEPGSFSTEEILEDICQYCIGPQKDQLDSWRNIMNTMNLFQTYKDLFSGMDFEGGDGGNPMDMIKTMLSPEQQSAFETYSDMFDTQ